MAIKHSRAPQGARGLKCSMLRRYSGNVTSRPARGAWVEILVGGGNGDQTQSRPARGAWVEIDLGGEVSAGNGGRAPQGARGLKLLMPLDVFADVERSRPARGAWVEIGKTAPVQPPPEVAPRKGRVG